MVAIPAPAKVLVTGASGFVAIWVVEYLLEHGYTVVGTVRSDSKGEYLKKRFVKYGDRFSYIIVEDVQKEDAFDEAVKGVDAVEHTASPFHNDADEPGEVIDPAVKGTAGILKSVLKNGNNVKRVVITSSIAAVLESKEYDPTYVFTERDWNKEAPKAIEDQGKDASGATKYMASKTLAEHAAWDFMEENKSKVNFDLATVNPGLVFGPFIHQVDSAEKLNTSVAQFRQMVFLNKLSNEDLAKPAGTWVDVRDVAACHVAALGMEQAGGERFQATAGPFSWQELLDALNEDGRFKGIQKGNPGSFKKERQYHSGEKASRILGVKFRSLKECAVDTALSLKERGWTE